MERDMEDSVLSLDVRDEEQDIDHHNPSPYMFTQHDVDMFPHHDPEMLTLHLPTSPRRTIRFIASLNGCSNGPRDFVYYDSDVHASMPDLATNSLRLCVEPNNLPPGTGTLTYPGNHQQIASVSGLHGSIIEDRSPLLATAFESSSSGRRLHLETLSSETVMPFLRFLYTGSCATSGDWEDVPTSVLLHCKMYWLGDLYDLPDLKSQAYVNIIRQFEFGCSSPDKPIHLCKAIDFAYKTLPSHDSISDVIVQYCVTRCLSHKLHEDADFRDLAYNVRAFHQDLTRVCRERSYEDESSAIIIQLPYKHFAPETYASRENPPVTGFHDDVYHFHSSDKFDDKLSAKKNERVTLDEKRALPVEIPRVPGLSKRPALNVVHSTSPVDEKSPIKNVELPIRQRIPSPQNPERSSESDLELPVRQLDDGLENLSTAPPGPGFFGRWDSRDVRNAEPLDFDRYPVSGTYKGENSWRNTVSKYVPQVPAYVGNRRRTTTESSDVSETSFFNLPSMQEYRQAMQDPEHEERQYKYTRVPTSKPQTSNNVSASSNNPTADGASSEAPQAAAPTHLKREPLSMAEARVKAKEIKRRKVEEQDRKDFDTSNAWRRSSHTHLQSHRRPKTEPFPSFSNRSGSYEHAYWNHATTLHNNDTMDTARFAPSNVSPTLPPNVFGNFGAERDLPLVNIGPPPVRLTEENLSNSQRIMGPVDSQEPERSSSIASNATSAAAPSRCPIDPGSHALQDYSLQLNLLGQQYKKRRLMAARLEQTASNATNSTAPPALKNEIATSTTSADEQASVVCTAAADRGSDVLEQFDFDAFLGPQDYQPEPDHTFRDYLTQLHMLQGQTGRHLLMEDPEQEETLATSHDTIVGDRDADGPGNSGPNSSERNVESSKAAPQTMFDLLNAGACAMQSIPTELQKKPEVALEADKSPTEGSSPKGTHVSNGSASESDVDMCETDSDSDMSWVDVPVINPKPAASTVAATGPASSSSAKPASTNKRRSSTPSDSEWDFC